MSSLVNEQPAPTAGVVPLPQPRPVWVGCLWQHDGDQVKETVPAWATHRSGTLILCDFWDPRTGDERAHWMEASFVRPRPIRTRTPQVRRHPAAAPSPRTVVPGTPRPRSRE
ncbi:hypothetical protein [Aeromicrobium sp. CnD17-E]|uniref:hypothetical protein n=1 Tax=Aeromicrobium sp. CnD17-E TaxID=2954487 RepID=UPI002097E7C6|nr:hypothetical protein [Aeromicrobium sp. CnD17-E]MCO7240894.1 hypothetical protein [Aeromicrobium sp. CnD17-E]